MNQSLPHARRTERKLPFRMVRYGRLVVKDTEEEKEEEEEHVGNTDMSSFSHSHYLASFQALRLMNRRLVRTITVRSDRPELPIEGGTENNGKTVQAYRHISTLCVCLSSSSSVCAASVGRGPACVCFCVPLGLSDALGLVELASFDFRGRRLTVIFSCPTGDIRRTTAPPR